MLDLEARQRRNQRQYARHKERVATDPAYSKKQNLKKHLAHYYGMSLTKYYALVAAQDNKCAICGLPPNEGKRLDVEHCHKTEAIRGLCCHKCNLGLKHFNDDVELLRLAVAYLEKRATP